MKLDELKNKSILILGFGKEGRDTLSFLRELFPKKVFGVADKMEKEDFNYSVLGLKLHLEKTYLKAIKNYDVVIKSPGVPIHLPEIERAFRAGKITSQTEIFFDNCPGTIIGITGTKGKSTTTSLIYKVLKDGGKKVFLVGNIGTPVLTSLLKAKKDDVFVFELSSHQLYGMKKSPHVSVLLNIFPEHLDYYKNIKEYAEAKANIALWQAKDDYLVFNSQDKTVKSIARKSKAKKIPIKGKYYELTRAAALEVGEIFMIPPRIISKAIKSFKPLPHRLELVGTFGGIKFYDDSISTIPETAIGAMDFLGRNVETMFLGGFDRGLKFDILANRLMKSHVKTLIFFPATGKRIWLALKRRGGEKKFRVFFVNSMPEAVKLAFENTKEGKICLLSPASPSFGLFKDYQDRGEQFKECARKYAIMKQ